MPRRDVIFERRILVKREEAMVVNLQRGTQRQTYNCTPQCNPTVTVGDEQAYFDAIVKAAEKKSGLSEKAADGPQRGRPVTDRYRDPSLAEAPTGALARA